MTEDFIETYTGKKFHFMHPTSDEVDIKDIAHALSLKCRFNGHCREFYSVGEHSIRVARILPTEYMLEGLLHDSTEAYWPDVVRPVKVTFGLIKYEKVIWKTIREKFGLSKNISHKVIKEADNIILATESRDLMNNRLDWGKLPPPMESTIIPIPTPKMVEILFLVLFKELTYGNKS
jgi:uncharacterized protein